MEKEITGRINSIQTLGTLDGPGVRFVVFMQGCNLRCGCCHNPDTWNMADGTVYTAVELADKAEHYREYFGEDGGVTLSGGEPLMQPQFAKAFFEECHRRGLNTCLDTSGSILNDDVKELLEYTDRVLLDIKYTTEEQYLEFVGCSMKKPLEFLAYLNEKNIPVTLRQVTIPTLNDDERNIQSLGEIVKNHTCVDKAELLPFKKICKVKYDKMGLDFEFEKFETPSTETMNSLQKILNKKVLAE